jgi:tetratricopeptide (TPR) repeat protein
MQMRSAIFRLFACLAVVALAALPMVAAAEDRDPCKTQSGELGVAECSRAIDSHQYTGRTLARLHVGRGMAWAAKRELDRAIADFEQAIRINPKDAEAYYSRGLARKLKGDLEAAIADYDQAIQLDAKYANAYVNRGAAWGEKGDLDRAIADFDEAIRLNPKEPQAYYNRGMAREMKRSLREALADFKMHSQLAPSNPDGRKAAARVQKKLSAR